MSIALGVLIARLKEQPPANPVRFDFCNFIPTELMSYRGDYYQLALGYEDFRKGQAPLVADLLLKLSAAVGKKFEGYKGGEYYMHLETGVWVDRYGDATGTAITGVAQLEHETLLLTGRTGL